MSTTLATLLLVNELAAPASTPADPPVTDDTPEALEVDPDAPSADALPVEPSAPPEPELPPEDAPMDPAEADPWTETPPTEHSPPPAVAVERQAGDGLSQALKQPSY